MTKRYPDWELTEARKRMARFPFPAKILRPGPPEDLWVPVVVVNDNVHILPGIPRLFERLLTGLKPHFQQMAGGRRYYRVQIATRLNEGEIAQPLASLQQRVTSQHIKIGSYPKWGADAEGVRVVISVVGKNEDEVKRVGDEVAKMIDGWLYKPLQAIEDTDSKV